MKKIKKNEKNSEKSKKKFFFKKKNQETIKNEHIKLLKKCQGSLYSDLLSFLLSLCTAWARHTSWCCERTGALSLKPSGNSVDLSSHFILVSLDLDSSSRAGLFVCGLCFVTKNEKKKQIYMCIKLKNEKTKKSK